MSLAYGFRIQTEGEVPPALTKFLQHYSLTRLPLQTGWAVGRSLPRLQYRWRENPRAQESAHRYQLSIPPEVYDYLHQHSIYELFATILSEGRELNRIHGWGVRFFPAALYLL